MLLCSVDELENYFRNNDNVVLYGLGEACLILQAWLESKGFSDKVGKIALSDKNGYPDNFSNKVVCSLKELVEAEESANVFIATFENLHKEISGALFKCGIKEYVAAKDEVLLTLKNISLQCVLQKELVSDECVVKKLSAQQNERDRSALFLSPPYWDVYSPFSAVPSIVGMLREKGFLTKQVDIGIECFNYILSRVWKQVSYSFFSYKFYIEDVCLYKNNPYKSYADYCDGLWFFHGKEFPLEEIKNQYERMNDVQKGIIGCLYNYILSLDTKMINFNTIDSIFDLVEKYSSNALNAVLISDNMKPIFSNLPSIVGISATGIGQFLPACKLAYLLKRIKPDIKLIMGGSCVDLFVESLYPSKRDLYKYFDFLVVGEGETAVWKLVDCLLSNGEGIDNIPNIAHIDESNVVSYAAQILEDVEELPLADYSDLDLSRYMAPRTILPYQASRGCHYGYCAFCNHNEKYRHNYRMKSKEKIVNDIVNLSKTYGVRDIQFVDEAIRPDHFKAIVEEMDRALEYHDIDWFYYSRVSREYTYELLKKAGLCGCKMVMFGVETFNQRLLNFIKKGILADTSIHCLRLFHETGIKTFAWLMGNLPSETLDEIRADIKMVEQNYPYIDAAGVGAFSLEINTDMYHNQEAYNILSIDMDNTTMFDSHNNGVIINKTDVMNCMHNEYGPMLRELFFYRDRYQIYFEK